MCIKKKLNKFMAVGVLVGMMSFIPSVVDVPIISGISVAHAQEDDAYTKKINEISNLLINTRYNDAINICNELIKNNQNRWEAYRDRAFAYTRIHQYDKALEDINKAISLAPDEPIPYWHKAAIYEGMHQSDKVRECYEQLIEVYTKLIKKDPNKSSYYLNRATVYYYKFNDYNRAIEDYRKGLSLPDDEVYPDSLKKSYPNIEKEARATHYWSCGQCYQKINDYVNAIEMYTKAIELNPKNLLYWQDRGKCYKAIGEDDKAKADFVEAEVRSHGGQ